MFRNVLSHMGILLEIAAVFSLVPLVFAFTYGEDAYPFFIMTICFLFTGLILEKSFPRLELTVLEGIKLTALSFFTLSLIGSLPYLYFVGREMGILNCLFESVSGFTTTGLTVFPDPSTLPKSLLIWRSFTQWLGGLGIIVVFLAIIRASSFSPINLFISQNIERKIGDDIKSVARKMINIYSFYTLLGIALFYLAGLDVFDSINYAFTSISTGGFQTSSEFPAQPAVMVAALIMMFIGATSFVIHDKFLRGRFREIVKSAELRLFVFFTLAFGAYLFLQTHDVVLSTFQIVSGITTTGYQIYDIGALKDILIFGFVIAMLIGGNVNSTAGGIKTARVGTMLSSIFWTIKKITSPKRAIIPFKFGDEVLSDENVRTAFVFFFTYIVIVILSTFFISSFGYPLKHAAFQSISAMGTVGLNTLNVSSLPALVRIDLMILMLLGRLEIFPLIALFKR